MKSSKATQLTEIVLPLPVWAIPTLSLPDRAHEKPWAWIGVGSLNFILWIVFAT